MQVNSTIQESSEILKLKLFNNLHLIIPLIMGALSVLTIYAVLRLTETYLNGEEVSSYMKLWGAGLIILTFAFGFFLAKMLVSSTKRSEQDREQEPEIERSTAELIKPSFQKKANEALFNEIDHFNLAFRRSPMH